jgi:hypothetical protein
MKKLMGLVAAVGMLCLAPAISSASVINFDFVTKGTLDVDLCGLGCYSIETSGTAYDFADEVPGTSSWAFSGHMTFDGAPWLGATDTSWSFIDNSGGNDLSGTFSWTLDDGLKASYDITGGSGLFAGATGTGSSVISITRWYSGLPEFLEVGTMHVRTPPTRVPEPSLTGLVAAGLMMVGFGAYRRRRADVTRR